MKKIVFLLRFCGLLWQEIPTAVYFGTVYQAYVNNNEGFGGVPTQVFKE